jgi:hypothetical protein
MYLARLRASEKSGALFLVLSAARATGRAATAGGSKRAQTVRRSGEMSCE